MLILDSHITITTAKDLIEFTFVNNIEVSSTWKTLTDMGKITIPRKLSFQGRDIVAGDDPLIKVGDRISIEVGYRPEPDIPRTRNNILTGYISAINPKLPIEIKVQDEMYLLKHTSVTKSYSSVTLTQLLKDILPAGTLYQNVDMTIGQLRITRASAAQVLEELQKTYGLESWFRGGKLYVGLAYVPALRNDVNFTFTKNIISDSLDYRVAENVQVSVKAVSILPDNSRLTYTTGGVDLSGNKLETTGCEERTLYAYNLSQTDLESWANREIEKLRYTGFYGKFVAFGEPFVRHGDAAVISDPVLPERNGTYLIKQVNYRFGVEGWRQEIELANKIL